MGRRSVRRWRWLDLGCRSFARGLRGNPLVLNLEKNWSFSPRNAEPQLRFDAPKAQTCWGSALPSAEVFESSMNLKEMVLGQRASNCSPVITDGFQNGARQLLPVPRGCDPLHVLRVRKKSPLNEHTG